MNADAHSVLVPAGPQAAGIAHLWWIYFGVCLVIALAIIGLTAALALRRTPVTAPDVAGDSRLARIVGGAVILSVLIVFGLLIVDLVIARSLRVPADRPALSIEVTGHQWWWSVRYLDPAVHKSFVTANEIHVPVGRTVRLLLKSADVIHSFWAPSFAGKKDLVPGHPAELTFQADRAGTFRGQCAEFCGLQHAHMDLVIVAEPPKQFEAWATASRGDGAVARGDSAVRGRAVFMSHSCALCHTIEGTPARSQVGPDLTHLASRTTIGAGAFPNTRGYLAGWIVDAPSLKPGVSMPPNPLPGDDLQALLDYLESLK